MVRWLYIYVWVLLGSIFLGDTLSAQSREVVNLHFGCDSSEVDTLSLENVAALGCIRSLLPRFGGDSVVLDFVYLTSLSSPEGSEVYNHDLAMRRTLATRELLRRGDLALPDSLVHLVAGGVAWEELRAAVEGSDVPYRRDVMRLLEGDGADLRSLRGESYSYLERNILPSLRRSSVTFVYHRAAPPIPMYLEPSWRPLFAIKTNLLFDVMTLINAEVEIPIGERWSVAGEWIFPWWVWDNHRADSRRNRIQLLNGNLEGRYWLSNREPREILTGWFAGLYAGGGLYDFERDAEGYQGEFFIAAGLSGGYEHTINRAKTLRMEYSLGLGYIQSNYRHYHATFCEEGQWHAVECSRGNFGWFGPTRARISISYLIRSKRRGM